MHRFYLPPERADSSLLTLSESESHHARHVLRLRNNERVIVLDGAGHELLCEVEESNRSAVTLKLVQKQTLPPLPYRLTLVQALTKAKTMDLILQKAAELGAYRIVPILSERSVPQVELDAVADKLAKWRTTMIEAIKQCGCAWLPHLDAPLSPQAFLAANERFDLSLLASLQPDARHPRVHFQSYLAEQQRLPKTVCVWVGPEGDFTPAESNAIRQAGASPITLGQLILRSETAAIYCLSVLNYELQAPRN